MSITPARAAALKLTALAVILMPSINPVFASAEFEDALQNPDTSSTLTLSLSPQSQLGFSASSFGKIKPALSGSATIKVHTPTIKVGMALEYARLQAPGADALFAAGYDRILLEDGTAARRHRLRASVQVSPSIRFTAGRDTLHDGYGLRSLFRGGHTAPAPFAQTEIDGGRIAYRHRIEALSASSPRPIQFSAGDPYRSSIERLAVSQRVTLRIGQRWEFALWGAVVWPIDGGSGRWFEPHYLVPIAALRPTEYAQGSSDNAMVGGEFRLNLSPADDIARHHASGPVISILPAPARYLYGQFILDELLLAHLMAGDSWWGNQWGLLGGLHWGLRRGHIQAELSAVRPYTYAHSSGAQSWVQGETPVAHALGAHFVEAQIELEQRRQAWILTALVSGSLRGEQGSQPINGDDDRISETAIWFEGKTRALAFGWLELGHALTWKGGGEIATLFAAVTARQVTHRTGGIEGPFSRPLDGPRESTATFMIGLRMGTPLRSANW